MDKVDYPHNETIKFIDELHEDNMAVVPIVDPAIKMDHRLQSYRLGILMDIFIKTADNRPYEGRVWPGRVHFVDFTHPNTSTYLQIMLERYKRVINFDGLWLDMNEPSNFDSGPVVMPDRGYFSLNHPKYDINNGDRRLALYDMTVPMDCKTWNGVKMLQLHNVYGLTEAILVRRLLDKMVPEMKRPFLLTRSVFPGSSQFTSSWLGDNHSTFSQLRESIWGVLKMSLFSGMAMTGPDLCGFNGDTDQELCTRWMALGAFFPFSRNHNSLSSLVDQEPYRFKSTLEATRKYYTVKYSLLPYWITLLELNRRRFEMVLRPFSMGNSTQFYVGRDLMVCPITERGQDRVECEFDHQFSWYPLLGGKVIDKGTEFKWIDAPLDHLPVFVRGGSILLLHDPQLTVHDTLRTNYTMHVYFENGLAEGTLHADTPELDEALYITIKATRTKKALLLETRNAEYKSKTGLYITRIITFDDDKTEEFNAEIGVDEPIKKKLKY